MLGQKLYQISFRKIHIPKGILKWPGLNHLL